MFKIVASIKKEVLLLINDRVGLALMFLMPLLLVFIITIIQDSVYKVVNENRIPLLVMNQDDGRLGGKLIAVLNNSGLFEIDSVAGDSDQNLKSELLAKGKMIALYVPKSFSAGLESNAGSVSQILMSDLGLEHDSTQRARVETPSLTFFHDPVLQDNYIISVMGVIQSYLGIISNALMIDNMYKDLDMGSQSDRLAKEIMENQVKINKVVATNDRSMAVPNSTQHNVPAWTIFAMFFMVVSLGSNIVKERVNGSFLRLKTMPTSFMVVMFSKMTVYVVVAILQVVVTFSMGIWVLPHFGLPTLTLPGNFLAFASVVFMSSMAAVSYALLIGSFAHTQEQANGFGAVSIVIFGAIGGILVPTFVMPAYMQSISNISPLHWCLEGFYILFLKRGSWHELQRVFLFLAIFISICQLCTYLKLKVEKIVS